MIARFLTSDDLAGLVDFWQRNGRSGVVDVASWQRRWSHNGIMAEAGPPLPIGWVLETKEGRIVGHLGNLALLYDFRGRRLRAAAASDWHVEPAQRTASLQLLSRFFGQSDVALFLNAFATDVASKAWMAFGGRKVPSPGSDDPLFRIIKYAAFGQSVFRRKGWPMAGLFGALAGGALRAGDAVGTLAGRRRTAVGVTVRAAGEFDARFDDFWARLRRESERLLLVRERKHLDWHFKDFLATQRGWITVCERDGGMAGYAVFVRKDNREIGVSRAWVADLQAVGPDQEPVLRTLLAAGAEECRRRGIHMIEAVGFSAGKREAIRTIFPRQRRFAQWPFLYRARDAVLAEGLAQPAVWDVCIMDGADAL